MPEPSAVDVVIIGGGPAGLSAAILLGRARRTVLVVDSNRPRNYAARIVNGYLGARGLSPWELRATGREQAAEVGVQFLEGEVTAVERDASLETASAPTMFRARLKSGDDRFARKIIFATGVRDEIPNLPGLEECYGVSVHHCPYCDGWEHRDERLAAWSEKPDSAARLAETLLRWSPRVVAMTNGSLFEAADRARLTALGIEVSETPISHLDHDEGRLRSVVFDSGRTDEADALFFAAPSDACCPLPKNLGCRLKQKGQVETTERQGTEVVGVFLAGDAGGCDVQSAIVAASEGAIAGMAVNKELHEEDVQHRLAQS
jgi:thioredoxin reductase